MGILMIGNCSPRSTLFSCHGPAASVAIGEYMVGAPSRDGCAPSHSRGVGDACDRTFVGCGARDELGERHRSTLPTTIAIEIAISFQPRAVVAKAKPSTVRSFIGGIGINANVRDGSSTAVLTH